MPRIGTVRRADRLVPGGGGRPGRCGHRRRRWHPARPRGGVGGRTWTRNVRPSSPVSPAFLAQAARDTSSRSLHYHGGYGFMLEFDVQLYFRRATGWPAVFGDPSDLRVVTRGGPAVAEGAADGWTSGWVNAATPSATKPGGSSTSTSPRGARGDPHHRRVPRPRLPPGPGRARSPRPRMAEGVRRPGPRPA